MNQSKKEYVAPILVVYGDVEKLTEAGGTMFQDSPVGTPIGSVTAS